RPGLPRGRALRLPHGPKAPGPRGAMRIRRPEGPAARGSGACLRRTGPPRGGRGLAKPIRPAEAAARVLRPGVRVDPGGVSRLSEARGPPLGREGLLLHRRQAGRRRAGPTMRVAFGMKAHSGWAALVV